MPPEDLPVHAASSRRDCYSLVVVLVRYFELHESAGHSLLPTCKRSTWVGRRRSAFRGPRGADAEMPDVHRRLARRARPFGAGSAGRPALAVACNGPGGGRLGRVHRPALS